MLVAYRRIITAHDALFVSEYSERVGDLANLFQEMADVDKADAFATQSAYQPEKSLYVLALQTARRLVKRTGLDRVPGI
jgi:hypothetical protein